MKNLNNRFRTIIAAVMMLIATLPSLAHDFEVKGIYYNITDETAKIVAVTYKGSEHYSYSNEYFGPITIPSSVTYSGITYTVTEIGEWAFYDCTGLTEVTIPNSVTEIGYLAFKGCIGLTEVTIPNSVTEIGYWAFECCIGLTEVTIPNSVTEIGDEAFKGCTGLTEVTIPNSVTEIGDEAFYGCIELTEVTIPNSVTKIGSEAFDDTGWYNNQADGAVYINNVLYKYKGTMPKGSSILIKDGTVSISPKAFGGCTGLTEVTIPNSVTKIGDEAFSGCTGLKSIIIQNPDVLIGEEAIPEGVEVIIEE